MIIYLNEMPLSYCPAMISLARILMKDVLEMLFLGISILDY